MLATVKSAGLYGIEAYPLDVEVDICLKSFPKWHTVGLAESEVKESKERVIAAIKNSGYDFIQRKITINLAPADIKKEGTAFDLPMALGLLSASGLINRKRLQSFLCVGELSLNGELRPVRGALSMAMLASKMLGSGEKIEGFILPKQNAGEATVVDGVPVYEMATLSEAVEFLEERLVKAPLPSQCFEESAKIQNPSAIDFDEICGQYHAKRALTVAAGGGHNLLFIGSPGAGKTMLASRIPTILPPLTFLESLETSRIYSVLAPLNHGGGLLAERPFRSPHHSVSDAGLIGGGSIPKPGEVSMAHNGVLFLDELPEFKKNVLELLRQPLEAGKVTITRASMSLTYPASFMLVAAMNPCPCGYLGHPKLACTCNPHGIYRYRSKLSGPLLDRIDLQIEVPPVAFADMMQTNPVHENSEGLRKKVVKTRQIQKERFLKEGVLLNAQMGPRLVKKYCSLNREGIQIMKSIMEKFHLSARAFNRILKVARTVADIDESSTIENSHLLEAVQYRSLDRNL